MEIKSYFHQVGVQMNNWDDVVAEVCTWSRNWISKRGYQETNIDEETEGISGK